MGLLQQAGRAVAALDDAYNAAYNASAAADGWGGQGHDVAELGEVSGGRSLDYVLCRVGCFWFVSVRCGAVRVEQPTR